LVSLRDCKKDRVTRLVDSPALWDVGSICQGVVSVLISGDPVGFAIEQKVMKHAPSVLSASVMAAPSSKL